MRVDFLGTFKDVQKLITSKPQESGDRQQFSEALEKLSSSEKTQVVEKIETKLLAEPIPKADLEQTRGRYDFAQPQLLAPSISPFQAPINSPQVVNPAPPSVKTPSGISGHIVKIENPFASLTKLQTKEAVSKLVSMAGQEHGIDPALSLGVIKAESNFNPTAVSNDGHESKGLMQLLDSTGKEMMGRLGMEELNYSPFDPEQNIDLGVGYLKRLHGLFETSSELGGNLKTFAAANSSSLEKLAVAAYNAGEGRVASAQQRANKAGRDPSLYENVEAYLPEITREYVKRVISARNDLSNKIKG